MRNEKTKLLESLFYDEKISHLFNESFLEKVPATQIQHILTDIKEKNGIPNYFESLEDKVIIYFDKSKIVASLIIDGYNKILGLWFGTTELKKSTQELIEDIRDLPGTTALSIITNGDYVFQHNSDLVLAVGSAAKLAVLAALEQAILEKKRAWEEIVLIDDRWKSVPSGILQDWPTGSPITISTLANLMISISDNTATDALIELVGRSSIEAITPHNTPFLNTKELVYLKEEYGSDCDGKWSSANREGKIIAIDELRRKSRLSVSSASKWSPPEAGWQMSTIDIYGLLESTHHLPAMKINPGLANIDEWKQISFKGGSDIGVLNLSSRLVDINGNTHSVIATWNDKKSLSEEVFVSIYKSILSNLGT